MKKVILTVLMNASLIIGVAQVSPLSMSLDINDEDGILIEKDLIQAFLSIHNVSDEKVSFTTDWKILTDNWQPLKTVRLTHTIMPNQTIRTDCPLYKFPKPGFYRIQVSVKIPEYQAEEYEQVIGINPEKLKETLSRNEDFDDFWKLALKELSNVKPEYNLILVPRKGDYKTTLYKVEMKSIQNKTVRGWLEVPKKKGIYPALLRVPGYQEDMKPLDISDDLIVFSFNTRDHGESDDSDGGRSWDMWVRGLESQNNYYYKGLFLDCIRAVDFLASRADIDQDRIAIWGGSQGGGLSFSTAALDDRIDLCISDIPYMCEYPKYFEITHWNEVDTWFSEHPDVTWNTVLNTLSYFDTKNFTDKIKCPVWMGIGLQDDVCPPSTSFVAFNKILSEKSYVVYKNQKHNQPNEHYSNRFEQLREFFKMDGDQAIKTK